MVELGTIGITGYDDIGPVIATSDVQSHTIIRMERLDLTVEQAVLLYGGVAVYRPHQAVRVFTGLMRLFAKHGWSWPPMDLNVSLGAAQRVFSHARIVAKVSLRRQAF